MPGLRPLGLGEILDVGIKLYLRNWRTLAGCVVFLVLPLQIVSVLVLLSVAPGDLTTTPGFGTSRTTVAPEDVDTLLAGEGVVVILALIVYALTTAACFKAVSDAYLGTPPAARPSLWFALRRLPVMAVMGFFAYLAIVCALVLLIAPGIWLSISWSLAIPALLFERLGPFGALRRSFRLVRGRWWPICGAIVVGVLMVSIVGAVVQGLLIAIPTIVFGDDKAVRAVANVIAATLASTITTPFTAAVITLLYFDQRVRKEGFDLQLLASGLGTAPDAPVARPVEYAPAEVTAEERAQAPYWPPPPGWKPPRAQPPAAAPPDAQAPAEEERPPWTERGWQPPRPPGRDADGS
jgi:hypothetical protein